MGLTHYAMRGDTGSSGAESRWRWSRKCEGMSYAGGADQGRRPAGGAHDGTQSGSYAVTWDLPTDTLLAPHELFRVSTLAASNDLDVGDGMHFRVSLSPAVRFPLCPFAGYRLAAEARYAAPPTRSEGWALTCAADAQIAG